MKNLLAIIYMSVCIFAPAGAQARFTSNTETQNLGQIKWKHPITAEYVITNTGNAPLVLTDVETDCACSVAQWTQEPIAPGEKGTVSVTFDAEALGHFQKSVAIYTNAEPNLVYLYLRGEVVHEIKDYSQTHPYLIGQIRIDHDSLDFSDIHYGEKRVLNIDVVNQSGETYRPVIMHLPPYLQMKTEPQVLQPEEKGIISLTLDSEKLMYFGTMETCVYLSRFSGDKVGQENKIPVSVTLLPDFSGISENGMQNVPDISISKQQAKANKNKVQQDITLTNTGHSPLTIHRLQVFHPAVGALLKKSILQPGESTNLRITVDRHLVDENTDRLYLQMVTDAPAHPKIKIDAEY